MSRYDGRRYPSDLTDAQWAILEPLVPKPSTQGRPPHLERRAIVNAILYVLRSGCPWRLLPLDFPAWQTVYYYFRRWQRAGMWDQMLVTLRMQMRVKHGRHPGYMITRGVRIWALAECGKIVHLSKPEHQARLVYFLADLLRPRR